MFESKKLCKSLFVLRFSVFVVMMVWVVDKFKNPDHTAKVFAHFYFIPELPEIASLGIGFIQMVLVFGLLLWYSKKPHLYSGFSYAWCFHPKHHWKIDGSL